MNPKHISSLIILIIAAFGLGISFFIVKSSGSKSCEEAYRELSEITFNGVAYKKYIDSTNHMNKLLVIRSNNEYLDTIWLSADKSGLYEYVLENDSIYKGGESYNVDVLRDKQLKQFIMDYKCR